VSTRSDGFHRLADPGPAEGVDQRAPVEAPPVASADPEEVRTRTGTGLSPEVAQVSNGPRCDRSSRYRARRCHRLAQPAPWVTSVDGRGSRRVVIVGRLGRAVGRRQPLPGAGPKNGIRDFIETAVQIGSSQAHPETRSFRSGWSADDHKRQERNSSLRRSKTPLAARSRGSQWPGP
jgi:hypothetical protein